MNDTNTRLVINPVTRTIAPKYRNQKAVYVAKNDHNSVLICFELPRYVDGYDMSAEENVIHIHYANVSEEDMSKYSNGVSDAVNVEVETDEVTKEEIVSFCWRIPNTATRYAGVVSVGITFERYDNIDGKTEEVYSWSTAPYGKTIVWDSMDNSIEAVEREYNYLVETCNAIVATALRTDLHYLVDEALQEAKESGEFKGDKGDTGDKGDKGDDGFSPSVKVTNITGGHKVEITDETGTSSFDVIDGNGGENTVTKKTFVLSADQWETTDIGEFREEFNMYIANSLDLTFRSKNHSKEYTYGHPEKAIFVHLQSTATLEQRQAFENANIQFMIRGLWYRADETDPNSPIEYDYLVVAGTTSDVTPTVDIPIEVVIVGKTSTTVPFIAENGNWWVGTTDTGVRANGYTPQKYIDYWTEEDKREIGTTHSGAYRVSKSGTNTLTLDDVDKPEHNMTVSAIKPASIDFSGIKRALEDAGYTCEEIENGFILNGTNTNSDDVLGMAHPTVENGVTYRVRLYCNDSKLSQNLLLMHGDGEWFEPSSEPKYVKNITPLNLNIYAEERITLNDAKLIFSVEEIMPNITFKVYGNSSEYTEYITDENGQAIVKSIYPYMRMVTTTSGFNLAVEYNKDLNRAFDKTVEYLSDYVAKQLENVNITLDEEMSDTSENAVKNKVIKAYVDNAIGEALEGDY